jgi:hypothetical protein
VKTRPLQIVSSDEFWAIERRFAEAHHARHGHQQLDKQTANYDRFYDTLVRHLRAVGSHREGFSGADFLTSRDVDPNDVTVVVSETSLVFNSGALDAALAAIVESGATHMVIFATGSYIGVLPDGSVIGYSEREDLLACETCKMSGGATSARRT